MAVANPTIITRGDVSPREMPGSPVFQETNGAPSVTRMYKGLYKDLLEMRPAPGSLLQGFDNLGPLVARETQLTRGNGETGVLTVKYGPPDDTGEDDGGGEGTLSVSFDAVEKPLLTHPFFKGVDEGKVEAWRKSPPGLVAQYKYEKEDGDPGDLEGKDKDAAKKIAKGIESWVFFAPVVKLTSTHKSRPSGVGAANGKREKPPVKVDGAWVFLRMGDECSRDENGVWTLTRCWQGALEWDEDLYAEA